GGRRRAGFAPEANSPASKTPGASRSGIGSKHDMNNINWRWLAVALFTINTIVFVLGQFGTTPVPVREGELPPLDPKLPRAELVERDRESDEPGPRCYTIGPLPTLLSR